MKGTAVSEPINPNPFLRHCITRSFVPSSVWCEEELKKVS